VDPRYLLYLLGTSSLSISFHGGFLSLSFFLFLLLLLLLLLLLFLLLHLSPPTRSLQTHLPLIPPITGYSQFYLTNSFKLKKKKKAKFVQQKLANMKTHLQA
jgi:ABC-type multidrug transport system permease subunit